SVMRSLLMKRVAFGDAGAPASGAGGGYHTGRLEDVVSTPPSPSARGSSDVRAARGGPARPREGRSPEALPARPPLRFRAAARPRRPERGALLRGRARGVDAEDLRRARGAARRRGALPAVLPGGRVAR